MSDFEFTGATCFSGIGAPELGGEEFDWKFCAEIEPFPAAVLANRFGATAPRYMPSPDDANLDEDEVKSRRAAIKAVASINGGNRSVNLGDVSNPRFIEDALALGPIDLLVGGPPCQAFSFAGLRESLEDDRGNLSLRFVEIYHAIRPRILLVENVPGWLSTDDNAFGCFLGAIVGANSPLPNPLGGKWPDSGMVAGAGARVAWRVFDAQYFGLAQRRRRVFVVVCSRGDDPARILFERRGLRGRVKKGRKARQGGELAGTLSARTQGGGGLGTDFELDGGIQPVAARMLAFGDYQIDGTASTIKARDWKDATDLVISQPPELPATLRAEGFDATEDGSGRTTLIPQLVGALDTQCGLDKMTEQSFKAGHAVVVTNPEIAGTICADSFTGGAQFEGPHDTANLRAASGGSSRSYVLTNLAVRKLTPVECERLQGFPDNFTAIFSGKRRSVSPEMQNYLSGIHGLEVNVDEGRLKTNVAADAPRYKSLGNSWAVKCGRWIIRRIYLEMKGELI